MWNKLKEQFNLLKLEKKKLYLITNSDKFSSKDEFLDALASSIQGGVDIVMFRETSIPDNVIVELGQKIRALCDEFGTTLIVNDRVDIASIIEADGVHLGQDDISVEDAKKVLGENAIIGKTTHNPYEAVAAINEGVDYITFEALPQEDESVEDYIQWVNDNVDIPVFICGEININNINQFIQQGAQKIALTEAIMYASVPEEAARKFLTYLP